jgi:hypothetical protein
MGTTPSVAGVTAKFPGIVLIDPRENAPFAFTDLPLSVSVKTLYLMSGDYSIEGCQDKIACERKSCNDLYSTLGAASRRARFETELDRLSALVVGVVVVEATWDDVCFPPGGVGSWLPPAAVVRYITDYRKQYPRVDWRFVDGRRAAEIEVYSILLRFAEGQA